MSNNRDPNSPFNELNNKPRFDDTERKAMVRLAYVILKALHPEQTQEDILAEAILIANVAMTLL